MNVIELSCLDAFISAAVGLHEAVIEEGAITPDAIAGLLERLTPGLGEDERRFVLRLSAWLAAYTADTLDEAMLKALNAARWTHALSAIAVESRWAAFDLRVSRGEHADDPDKNRLRAEEVEYFRPCVVGISSWEFGRLFREQLAASPAAGTGGNRTV